MKQINVKATEIDLQPIEEDTTYFSDNEQVELKRVNFEYEQYNKLHGLYRKLTVFNDTHCYLAIKNKHQRKFKYRIDLAHLEPRPYRSRIFAWKWLVAAVFFLAFDTVLVFSEWIETSATNYIIIYVAVTSVAIILVLGFFYHSHDKVYFRSQYGKIRLIEMINGNPERARFHRFIKVFIKQIIKSKVAKNLNAGLSLKQELQELRRLKDEMVIPKNSYEKAKKAILNHKAFNNA